MSIDDEFEKGCGARVDINFTATVTIRGRKFYCTARQLIARGTFSANSHKELGAKDVQVELISHSPNPVLLNGTVVFAIPIGKDIELELSFQSLNTVLLSGTALYAVPTGVGVRFGKVSVEHRQIWQTYLDAYGYGLLSRN
jgi:hypothetical protein